MFKNGIQINWKYGTEYIELNLDSLSTMTQIRSTIEVWNDGTGAVQYDVDSEVREGSKNGIFEIFLTYKTAPVNSTDNLIHQLIKGTSEIKIEVGSDVGTAKFTGFTNHAEDGVAKWKKIPSGLVGPRKRQAISRIQREQQQLRAALLLLDGCCAITSVKLPDILDAAHIIAAKDGGLEKIENAILLRADIHRLLDSGAISIDSDGVVLVANNELPKDYMKLLQGKKIPNSVHVRISEALTINKSRI